MRILYDHQVFSLQDAGGASRYHYELLKNLQRMAGVETEMLLGLNGSVMPFAALRRPPNKMHASRTRLKPGVLRYAANEMLTALVAPSAGTFDIYHPTLYRVLPWVRRRRVVVTHHDCTYERFPHLFPKAASIIAAKRKLFAQADAIICVSESSRRDLFHFYEVAEEKVHVVHHGFSPFEGADAEAAQKPLGQEPYLLYVGSRAGYKNFGLLLEAFSQSGLAGQYHLLAVGGGPFSEEEHKRIASLGLMPSISLISKTSDQVLAQAYRGAALFIYPSLYEGFGFPPLEAMSLGCPVLVNRTSALPEICGDAAFYFDVAGDLAATLRSTLQDPQALAAKRQPGDHQAALYDWGRCAQQTLEVYRKVLNA